MKTTKRQRKNEVAAAIEYFNMHIETLQQPGHTHRTFEYLGKAYRLDAAKETLKELQDEFADINGVKINRDEAGNFSLDGIVAI